MTIAAQEIIKRVIVYLSDKTSIHWSIDQIAQFFNDTQRDIVLVRPDSNPKTVTGTLAAGARQTLTSISEVATLNPAKLLNVSRNMASASAKGAITPCNRDMLDRNYPTWYAATGKIDVVHYMFDEREPLVFYTYPPALNTSQVEITFSAYPTDITVPAIGGTVSDITGNFALPDIFMGAQIDGILSKCFAVDAEFGGNQARAQYHDQLFAGKLGMERVATKNNSPQ